MNHGFFAALGSSRGNGEPVIVRRSSRERFVRDHMRSVTSEFQSAPLVGFSSPSIYALNAAAETRHSLLSAII
jgi:hypothetical protein